jgi:hypothetical protein
VPSRELLLPRHKTCNLKSSMKIDGNKTSERSERDKSAFISAVHSERERERETRRLIYSFFIYARTHTHENKCV